MDIIAFLIQYDYVIVASVLISSFLFYYYRRKKIHYRIRVEKKLNGELEYKAEHRRGLFHKWESGYLGLHSVGKPLRRRAEYVLMGWRKLELSATKEEIHHSKVVYDEYEIETIDELEKELFRTKDY
ncbi:MAG: hypothetical protein CFE25_07465 [Chitinophagaceae bacterium BSSC1]|nr:MAG: hypothetical protein CFE25_07465 [Chitinophagaceae bacterium BSSC1]